MRALIQLAVLLCAVAAPSSLLAQTQIPYSPEERFKVNTDESNGASSNNVVIQKIDLGDAPTYIENQAKLIASDCTSSSDNVYKISAYSYISDLNRTKKLPPNYILDLTQLRDAKIKHCIFGRICENGLCSLIGYNPIGNSAWGLNFSTMASSWVQQTRKGSAEGAPSSTTIKISTPLNGSCESNGGIPDEDQRLCSKEFLWGSFGLTPLQK